MNYLLIGLLLSIGWGLGKTITNSLDEVIYKSLRRTRWFNKLTSNSGTKSANKRYSDTKIGFLK